MTRWFFLHPSPWQAAPKVDAGRVFDLVFDVWLFLLCVGVLEGCQTCTLYQRHANDPTDPEPWYLASVCHEGTPQQTTTLICTSKTRLKTGARDCK